MNIVPSKVMAALDLPYEEQRELLRFGFELETQETNGHKRDQGEEPADSLYRSHYRRVAEARLVTNDYTIEDLTDAMRNRFDYWRARSREVLIGLFQQLNIVTIHDIAEHGFINRLDADELRVAYSGTSVRGHLIDVIIDRLESSEDEEIPGILTKHIKSIDIGTDMTVTGFEFRTIDGSSYTDIINIAQQLIEDNNHTIDVGCSFHVHVSLPEVFEPCLKPVNDHDFEDHGWATERTTNTGFAAQCMASIMNHIDMVPTRVLQRWLDPETRNNFLFRIGAREKYEFVHIHDTGTVEFRCFGNVATFKDAEICINLAANAIWDALSNKYPMVVPYLLPQTYESIIDGYLTTISNEFNKREAVA